MYNEFGKKATITITSALRAILKKLHIDIYIAPPDVVMEVTLVKPSEILKTAKKASKTSNVNEYGELQDDSGTSSL